MQRIEKIVNHFHTGTPTYVKVIGELEGFELEIGMVALVKNVEWKKDMYKIYLALDNTLIERNKPFETRDFYDKNQVPCLNYREAFKVTDYFETFIYDCDDKSLCGAVIKLYKPNRWFKKYMKSQFKGTYIEFLEYKLNLWNTEKE